MPGPSPGTMRLRRLVMPITPDGAFGTLVISGTRMISWTDMMGMPYSSSATRKVINCSLSSSAACLAAWLSGAGRSRGLPLAGTAAAPHHDHVVEQGVLVQEHHQATT